MADLKNKQTILLKLKSLFTKKQKKQYDIKKNNFVAKG